MLHRSIPPITVMVCAFVISTANAQAQSNSKGRDSSVVVGVIKSVDSSGSKLSVLQDGEHLRTLHLNSESKVWFIGFPDTDEQKPAAGLGVKATCNKDGRVKTIGLTPAVGEPAMLGEKRLTMTVRELFRSVDRDTSNSVSYVEFSRHIYHSPKHSPDSFRKADSNSDGVLDSSEFAEALGKVSWWKLSRRTPDEWFRQADNNEDEKLDLKEFAMICTSGNHIENIFKRSDDNNDGSLTQQEITAYIRSVTHGKQRKKTTRKPKRDKQ